MHPTLLILERRWRAAPSICVLLVIAPLATSQGSTFRAESNSVSVPTLVKSVNGDAIYGLHSEDFVIEDDGVQQAVHLEEVAETEPVSLVIAVQCGRRAKREFDRISGFASMLDPVLTEPDAEAALLFFDSKLNLAHDFSSDANGIEADLKKIQEGDGGAAILDAVAYS